MVRELDLERSLSAAGGETFRIGSRGPWIAGVLSYGTRPTFKKLEGEVTPLPIPEVYILDFEGELYGKTMELVFFPRLRPEATFDSAQALKDQIAEDIEQARRYFETLPNKNFTRSGGLGYTDGHN
jgi:riboflavin kinase/FMN adenylyltransferase